MRKIIAAVIVLLIATTAFCQQSEKLEVLYFKDNLSCCAARACNALEAQVKQLVEDNFDGNVIFKEVKLIDKDNKSLIKEFKAGSQTLGIANSEGEKISDASDILRAYVKTNDQKKFEADLKAEINKYLK